MYSNIIEYNALGVSEKHSSLYSVIFSSAVNVKNYKTYFRQVKFS